MIDPSPSVPEIPADIATLLRDLEQSDEEAKALVAGLTDAQCVWQPNGGRAWSVAQCLDHLTKGNTTYHAAMTEGLAAARKRGAPARSGPIEPGFFARWFIATLEPPPRRRLPAPSKIIPTLVTSREEMLAAFLRSQAEVRRMLVDVARLDLNRIRFQNPFLPLVKVTLGAGFLILAAHDRRHLLQARRVTEAAGFPRG